jgi:hypothetical protein
MLDFNNSKVLEAVRWYVEEAVKFDLTEKARSAALFLENNFSAAKVERPEDELAYQNLLAKAKFVSIMDLTPGEIENLLKNNLSVVLGMPGYDIWKKIKVKLISLPEFDGRNSLRKTIREALLASEQEWTGEKIINSGREIKGTVKNWLMDYNSVVGTGKIETLKLSQYLTNGENTKKISQESRQRLDYLLKFYEKMKQSSLDIEGIEEATLFLVDDELDIYEDGIAERIGRDIEDTVKRLRGVEMAREIQDEIQAKYRGDEAEAKKIEAEIKKIRKVAGGDAKKIGEMLFLAIPGAGRRANKIEIIAILKILAESGQLGNLLGEKEFGEMMVDYLKKGNHKAELDGFKLNPKNPEYLGIFLKYILVEKAGMSEDDSGRIGMQLFNALASGGKENKYQGLVYFDLEEKKFKWS